MPEAVKPKKLLILADWYEPGYKAGGPIQSVKNFVVAMHESYSISILTRDTDLGTTDPYPGIPSDQWISREPGIRIYYAGRKTLNRKLIRDLIDSQKPDFIYINSMYSVPFTIVPLFLLWRKKIQAVVVLSPRGMLRESAIKLKSTKKKLFIALLNRLHIPELIHFHATDPREKRDILRYFQLARIVEMIPNFSASLPENLSPIEKNPGSLRCVFISRIMAIKNISFFLELLKKVPDTIHLELAIYGEVENPSYWLESQNLIHSLPKHITVSYHGPLPHDRVIPTIEAHHVFVLPSRGENFGHAIFEALSAGRPVMISDRTPWRRMKEKGVGWDLTLDHPENWLAAIQEAADFSQSAFNVWSERCRQFAKDHLEKSDLKQEYVKLFS